MWGAQGSAYAQGIGGKGGYSVGYYNGNGLMYVCVGGKGTAYNGGGHEQVAGGDASHIAIKNNRGVLANYVNNKSEVLIVAGGGGGSNDIGKGGAGGGLNGGAGEQVVYSGQTIVGGTGGTQTSGGTFPGNMTGQVIVSGTFGKEELVEIAVVTQEVLAAEAGMAAVELLFLVAVEEDLVMSIPAC